RFRRLFVLLQISLRRDEDARRAIAALQAMMTTEGFLQVVQATVLAANAANGIDRAASRLHGEYKTASRWPTVKQNGTGTTHALLACHMHFRTAELVS